MTYQSPGVYIEEVPSGPQPISAASTSVLAVLGTTRKGPVKKPTRITGWSDYVRRFGAASGRGFTAESVYGFFENGGPAAWVIRVDPSVGASWQVADTDGTDSFVITATSPGAWANAVTVGAAADFSGGMGTFARATVAASVSVAGSAIDVPVVSTGGLAPGDLVALLDHAGASRDATVNSVGSDTINVTKTAGGTIALTAGDTVALRTGATPTTLRLAAGSGIKAGDILVIQQPDGSRDDAVVAEAVSSGAGLTLTLTAPFASPVVGAGFAARRAVFAGTIGGGATTFALGDITWGIDPALAPVNSGGQMSNSRAVLSSGPVAEHSGASFQMPGTAIAPAGAVSVEAQMRAIPYSQAIDFTPASAQEVVDQFSFLPVGAAIVLANGAQTTTVTRETATTASSTGDALPQTFTLATFAMPSDASTGVVVKSAPAPRVGDYVDFSGAMLRVADVDNPGGTTYVLSFAETTDISAATGRFAIMAFESTRVFPGRFTLRVSESGAVVETFSGLALSPTHPAYFAKDDVVNGVSQYVTVVPRGAGAPGLSLDTLPGQVRLTQSGIDQPATTADYVEALTALEAQPEPAMVICPDTVRFEDPLLQADLIGKVVTHCESFRRFAIIDGPDEPDDTALLGWRNTSIASTSAAVFAPHVNVVTINPDSIDRYTKVPPSGFVAGVFARTDRERGVHKAPGNERVKGIVGLAEEYTERRQDLLNPASVNLIRAFPGRGSRIWGARNATDDATWRYINVRRLFNMIETSVDQSTQWVVFEPNTASTWIRVKVSVENFLDQLWRSGALAGTSPEQAYRVRVGLGETMTETDIDLGLIITEVAIAPAKPAEFVIFRFSHKRLSE